MWNAGLSEAQAGIKIARRNISNLRYVDVTTLMAESEENDPLDKGERGEWKKMAWNSTINELGSWQTVPSLPGK